MSPTRTRRPAGQVALVGAGTGEPGLLAQRAAELLRTADLVIADSGVSEAVLALAGPGAEVQVVEPDERQSPALVAAAKEGKRVVRLLPGDPYLTPEGAKEAEAVVKGKVRLEVVPGLPAPVAVPAFAGVPVGLPRTVARVEDSLDWGALAAAPGTLVLTCDVTEVPKAAAALVEHGRKGSTDIAVTVGGTTPAQRTVVAALDTVEGELGGLEGEAVVVVGEAARKVERLGWFEQRALYGWKVLVPRTRDQASSLSDALRAYGAIPVEVPTIAVEPPRTPAPMERAIKGLVTGRYLWIAFTSVNAVRAVLEKLREFGLDARAFAGVKIAAVGDATAAALRAYGIEPELVPTGEQSSEGLLREWQPYDEVFDPLDRVLLPRADIATDALVAGLKELGWAVDDVTAYRTVRAAPPPAETREALKGGGFDAVLFTSSSTVRNLVGIAGKPHDSTVLVAIGPQTKATAEELGLRVDVVSTKPDVAALVEGLAEHALALRAAGELPPSMRRRKGAKKARR
ncbi:MAG TPA: bifunctional uroporphyrinogen-III C-methyltransferase/uroporphyrinogen-III synthase [Mycobacteriales bacterium]|nr:bifunctional uroporphyrinogen-III C-methyltransferase/uroporphyrinogen-III synthase [Mycobacteriales bacterium]